MAGGIHEAYTLLRRKGVAMGGPDVALARLADIRRYLGTTDPIELGAALLLELAGCERGQLAFTFGDDDGGEG